MTPWLSRLRVGRGADDRDRPRRPQQLERIAHPRSGAGKAGTCAPWSPRSNLGFESPEAIVGRMPCCAPSSSTSTSRSPSPGPTSARRATAGSAGATASTLDPARYDDARRAAFETLERHPELDHDEEIWVLFTQRIIEGMGGTRATPTRCAVEMTRAWEHAHHFELFDDVLPTLERSARRAACRLGLLSNTARDLDAFVAHHGLDVDAVLTSRAHGKTKPHEAIFRRMLELLGVAPAEAAMVGDTVEDDIEGARAVGMRALLVDRDGRYRTPRRDRRDLRALPLALGLD